MTHTNFLEMAADQARISANTGGLAVGAVLVKNDEIIASSHDRSRQLNDPIATAEMNCIRQAGRRNDQAQLTLYSTRYPDMLIAGTILQFSIGAMVIGLSETSDSVIKLLKNKNISLTFLPTEQCEKPDARFVGKKVTLIFLFFNSLITEFEVSDNPITIAPMENCKIVPAISISG